MATYYKYAERDADSQINWYEVGKNLSDMLAETNRIREEKKTALAEAQRQSENQILDSVQGQNQDINNFTNRFVNIALNSARTDYKLLTSGQMSVEKYLLRRQNGMDGTKQLFDLAKLYQDEFKAKMEGVTSGELQALNIFNMNEIEGYANFNNAEAIIDILGDGRINIGLYETKNINGKEVRVLSNNVAPVNILAGKIRQNIKTFDVEGQTAAYVKNLGKIKDTLYEAAEITKAGTISEMMGINFLSQIKDPATQNIVKNMNDSIDKQVSSYFSNPYNLTSVLTQNTGKYDATSFTFDKEIAAKDKSKILVKIDPKTQMTTLDENGPNYKEQLDEAKSWVRSSIISKMDQERSIKPTSQLQLQERSVGGQELEMAKEQSRIFGEMAGRAVTSKNLAERQEAISFLDTKLVGTGFRVQNNPVGYDKGVYILDETTGEMMNLTRGKDTKTAVAALISGINEKLEEKYQEDIANTFGLKISRGKNVSDISTGPTRIKAGGAMSKYDKKQQ